MVDLQTISVLVQIVGVSATAIAAVIGVSSYINSNKRTEEAKKKEQETRDRELETREAQLFNSIYQYYISETMQNALLTLEQVELKNAGDWKALYNEREKLRSVSICIDYWDGVGVFVRENLIDIRLVALLMGGTVVFFWERFGDGLRDVRREYNFPRVALEVEYLHDRLKTFMGEHPELQFTSPSKDWNTKVLASQ
jgi:hypothetical protein